MKIRIAVAPPPTVDVVAFASALEGVGFDGIWLSDVPVAPVLDPLLALAQVAGATEKLHLGANVVPFGRTPYVLARTLAQLDRLSGGRLLLSFVSGLGQPGERTALGVPAAGLKGPLVESMLSDVRGLWAGVPGELPVEVVAAVQPVQDPLEVWLGGRGPQALERVGRVADGWLGAAVTVSETASARSAIQAAASAAGREVDPEHFGMSIPYARSTASGAQARAATRRRPDVAVQELVGIGREGLREMLGGYIAAGLSKFVVRPIDDDPSVTDHVGWLADAVLDLQT